MSSEFVAFIREVGFPIALVIWFLVRSEPLLRQITEDGRRRDSELSKRLEAVRAAIHEMRRAQLLYVIGHPAFSAPVKEQARKMLLEADVQPPEEPPRSDA